MTEQFKQMEQTIRCIIEVLGELVGDDMTVQGLDGIISSLLPKLSKNKLLIEVYREIKLK